jgi:polysaccharide biosynthesis transport protein
MATSMEQMQQGERFMMLDPPSLPVKPDFPNHLKLCGVGLGVGLALGIVVVFGLEFLDDRLHGEKELKALLSFAVVAEIPDIRTDLDLLRAKRKLALGWVVGAIELLAILVGSGFSYLYG